MGRLLRILTGVACAAALLPIATSALAGADDAAFRNYVLTMDKVHKYAEVGRALKATKDPAVQAELPKLDNFMGGSLAQALAKLRTAPHVEALVHRAGLSDNDFALIPLVAIGAAMAQNQPPAVQARMPVSAANIAFVKQHQADLKMMMSGD